jgi:O-antigen/teichoic acid export membrane protein
MGPVNVLISFAGLGLTPALVRRARRDDRRFCLVTATVMVALTAVWGTLLLLLPSSAGRSAFGESWDGIRSVLPLTVCEYLLSCITTAAILGLKVRHEPRPLRRLRVASATMTFIAGTTAALATGDVRHVAAALVLSAATAASLGWWSLLRSGSGSQSRPAIDVLRA